MLVASDEQVLEAFEAVHGKMTGQCRAEIVYDEEGDLVGVACMKDGHESWRATLAELAFDTLVRQGAGKPPSNGR